MYILIVEEIDHMTTDKIQESKEEKRLLKQLASYIKRNNMTADVIKYLGGDTAPQKFGTKKERSPIVQYVNNWSKSMNDTSSSLQDKIQLSKEIIDFMADRSGDPSITDELKSGVAQVIKNNLGKGQISNNNYRRMVKSVKTGMRLESKRYHLLSFILKESGHSFSSLGFVASKSKSPDTMIIREAVQ
jgi:hypothetical protein